MASSTADSTNGCSKKDRLIHPKVNEVRAKLEVYHEQKRHAGAKSGQARRERSMNGRSRFVETQLEPSPTPTPTPTPEPAPAPALLPEVLRPQTEYPETFKVLLEHDRSADVFFCQRIADAVARALIDHPEACRWPPDKQAKAISDRVISMACRESYATPRKGPHGSGLLLTTVPRIVIGGRANYV